MKRYPAFGFALVGLLASTSGRALAQEVVPEPTATQAAEGDAAEPTSKNGVALDEIVVTAERRSQNLQDVPIAVTAISADALEAAGVSSTSSLTSVTPGLTMGNTVGQQLPRIRGIGTASAGAGIENSVSTYIDGVYLASSPASLVNLSNVERVEVLKGPQGTLFGRNATGGLIQVVTRDPGSELAGEASISYGNYDTLHGDLYFTAPLSASVSADLAASIGKQGEGYGTNFYNGKDVYKTEIDLAARSKWLFELGASTRIRVTGDYEELKSSGPVIGPVAGSRPTFASAIVNYDARDVNLNVQPGYHVKSGGVSARTDHELDAFTITSITAYRKVSFDQAFDADLSPTPAIGVSYSEDDTQFSQELQIASPAASRVKWILGVYYFDLDAAYHPYQSATGTPLPATVTSTDAKSGTKSLAAFGQATLPLGERTNLTAGMRYTHDERRLTGGTVVRNGAGAVTATSSFAKKATYNTPTWRLALDHKFDRNIMGYISYNRGYRSGGFSAQAPAADGFRPEYVDAYAAGLKTELFGRRLRMNGEIYHYNYRDLQVVRYVNGQAVLYNGAKASIYGLDLDLSAAITSRLRLNAGLSLIHDRFTSFPAAEISAPLAGGGVSIVTGSAKGNRLPFTPDVTLTLGGSYIVPLGRGSLMINANQQYSSGFYGQPDNVLKQRSYSVINGSVRWDLPGSPFSVTAYVQNLLDADVASFMNVSSTGQAISYQPPRLYGLRLGVEF